MAPFLIMLTYFVGQAILLEAVLSYLGMGVQDPTPAWGLMLKGGAEEFPRERAVALDLPGASRSRLRCSGSTSSATPCGTCWIRSCGRVDAGRFSSCTQKSARERTG